MDSESAEDIVRRRLRTDAWWLRPGHTFSYGTPSEVAVMKEAGLIRRVQSGGREYIWVYTDLIEPFKTMIQL